MAAKQNLLEVDDLKKVWQIFARNWYWFILLPAISLVISYFYTHRLTDIYQARTQILLKSDDVYKFQNSGEANIYSMYENSSSQIRVIQSSDLIEKAISKLDFDVSYFIVGRVKVSEVYENMPFRVISDNFGSSAIRRQFRINLVDTSKYRLIYTSHEEEITREYNYGELILDEGFYFTIHKNSNLNEQSVEYLSKIYYMFSIQDRNSLVSKYKSGMAVKNLEWTSIIEVNVEDEIPERAVAFLDTLSAVFIENTMVNKRNISKNTIDYIDLQVNEILKIINEIEDEMERFKQTREIIDLNKEQSEAYSKLTALENKKLNLELKHTSIAELREYVLKNNDDMFLPPSFFILEADAFLKNTVNKLYDMQIKRSSILFHNTDKTLSIREMDTTFNRLQKDVLLYLINTQKFIEKGIEEINSEIRVYESEIKNYPQTQRQIVNIERKLNINQQLYSFLITKRAETVIAKASIIPETKIIERARSVGIIKPDKKSITSTFLGAGLVAALLISLIRFFFFERFQNVRELTEATELPVMGGLPFSEKGLEHYILVDMEPKSAITEAFRSIRTNLQYLSPEKKASKVVLITSLHPGEGKTFCSANLGVILAMANKKVLLLDLDLHRPKIHKSLKIDSDTGISTFLIGKNSYDSVKITSGYQNMDVIVSGPAPPNASEMILSEGIANLIESAKKDYDFIIIDTPPLGLISDAIVLMDHADVSLFIMNSKFASKQGLRYIEEIIEKGKIKSCGIILNGIKNRKWKYYYGGYGYRYGGYSYGYGYGYGYGKESEKAKIV